MEDMLKPNEITKDPFEQREIVDPAYWDDPRWKEVQRLRSGRHPDFPRANGLVAKIHADWGVD